MSRVTSNTNTDVLHYFFISDHFIHLIHHFDAKQIPFNSRFSET